MDKVKPDEVDFAYQKGRAKGQRETYQVALTHLQDLSERIDKLAVLYMKLRDHLDQEGKGLNG